MTDGIGSFEFLEPGNLFDGVVQLLLTSKHPANPLKGWVPYYAFRICSVASSKLAGNLHLRIGDMEHVRLYGGHIAYGVSAEYRGRRFAARSVRLVIPLAMQHGLRELWITCNPENLAPRRTCEAAGAELIEIVDLPPDTDMYLEGERQKCRYRLDLSTAL